MTELSLPRWDGKLSTIRKVRGKAMVKYKQFLAIVMTASMGITASGIASAHGMQQGPGSMGPGMMMDGMGPGVMMGGMSPGVMMGGMGPCMMGYGQGGMGHGMMQLLEPEQWSEMRELMQQHRSAQFERMEKMMDLRMALMEKMYSEAPDPEEVKTLHGQVAGLQSEMMGEMVRTRNALLNLLSDKQREQLRQGASSLNNQQ